MKVSKEKLKQIIKEEFDMLKENPFLRKSKPKSVGPEMPEGLEAAARQLGVAMQPFVHTDEPFFREIEETLRKFNKGVAQAFRDGFMNDSEEIYQAPFHRPVKR